MAKPMEQMKQTARTSRRWSARTATALALVTVLARPAAAQPAAPAQPPPDLSNLTLEELAGLDIDSVYGASMYLQKISEAPSSVTIISADDIDRYGYRTLADALRSVRGFYITNDRNYSYLGVRGFSRPGDYNARILLLIDGHRLNDNVFGSALLGTEFPLDIELIQRIEIIRGPSSSLYGTSAFFGVINIVTKRADGLKGLDVTGAAGTFASKRGRASYAQKFTNGATLLLSGSSFASHGQRNLYFEEFDSPETNDGIAEDADQDEASHLFGTATYGKFTVQGLFGTRDKVVPTASFGTVFNDPRSRTIETQAFLAAQYDRALKHGWQLGSRVSYNRYLYDGDYVFDHSDTGVATSVVNKDFARGDWWGAELKLSRKLGRRQKLALGAEYRDNVRQDQYNYDEGTSVEYLDDRRDSRNWALLAQDEITLHDKLLVNVGLRHDHYDTFGSTTNPRVGLIYTPATKSTVKLLYGEAFRAPNAYELFWSQTDLAKANPGLKPETNQTSEVVLEQALGARTRLTTTAFFYKVRDLITQQTDPIDNLLVYNNVDAIEARGLELELEGKSASGVEGRVGYTYQRSRNEETGLWLTNSPRHLANVNLMAPLIDRRLFGAVELRQMSSRRTISGNEVSSLFVANLTVSTRSLPKGLNLSASIFNLFDNQYADPGSEEHRQDSIVQSGRSFRVKLTVRFPRID
jgi:outer membrane receptor for ferrienterochelin and colicins